MSAQHTVSLRHQRCNYNARTDCAESGECENIDKVTEMSALQQVETAVKQTHRCIPSNASNLLRYI